ncbi:MAG: hypothetical protein ACOYK6_03360 [Chthoniobacterales bacterium]
MLFSVVMKGGQKTLVLLHLEIQGEKQSGFSCRMYDYHNLILDFYQEPVMSIALLLDEDSQWCPDCFEKKNPFTNAVYLYFKFYVVKVLHFISKLEKLPSRKNISSLVMHYQFAMMETKSDDYQRYKEKIKFTRELFQLGLNKKQTRRLFEFLD